MESNFFLKATDRQAQTLLNTSVATVKIIEFKGNKKQYPEMDINNSISHKWKIILRHKDEIGEIKGTFTFQGLMKKLTSNLFEYEISDCRL